MEKLTDVSKMTRDEVVPYYVALLKLSNPFHKEIGRVNRLILTKWTLSGLEYIKTQAWKQVL